MEMVCHAELGITMPLSKERNKERMRQLRTSVQPVCNLDDKIVVQPKLNPVQPKYDKGLMYPDGRMRLSDMTVVEPNSVKSFDMVTPFSKSKQAKGK